MTNKADKDPEYLSTLERGLRVLRAFDEHNPEMRLSEVAAKADLSPAVARRCLNTLVSLGYVGQYGRNFLLKPEVLAFGSAFMSSMNIEQVVSPSLQKLRDDMGDSASMAVIAGNDILYLAHVSTRRQIRLGASVGTRFPLHATSMGKAILAFRPDADIEDFLARADLKAFTPNTITRPEALRERLMQVRSQGYDSTCEELDMGIVSLAVPIFDASHVSIAAINCSTTTGRTNQQEMIATRLNGLRAAANEIQQALRRWPALLHAVGDYL
ncbi:MAG: IclR family transcriptional regulator domain-containing protein [Sphingobium phenoxybenzoativorans]|uniref:Helix-turn-helix domain-containing protein n=1 Tax=Sphingobium phenoxybenzoativorans TaxID=1592790 RepID=A0A975Q223_9SPHN|nr:IclR family transcriptional regulator C-terminal domain-containing protein [Sphingobium phenoxybenzoativorans]QUT06027.1 helix-turn-helix domain-containing protein [Sphingobium phenoxybenzoativorans]